MRIVRRVRALLLVLDSVGVGHAPDAATYGDEGANTLGHIFERVPDLRLPNLESCGLGQVIGGTCFRTSMFLSQSGRAEARPSVRRYRGSFGRMREQSAGKDTTTGHWEIAGVILEKPFATFEKFPLELVESIEADAGVKFIGNYARSGTTALEELSSEHMRTFHPILYTSADSVMQIAAHENALPVSRLYQICEIARRHCDDWRIGRVIARPFDDEPGNFRRTPRRHDFSMMPPRTVLNALSDAGIAVTGVGKIHDIFADSGINESHSTASNSEGMATIDQLWNDGADGLIFANLVDFDMLFGHRRDVSEYTSALEEFDQWLGNFLPRVQADDFVIITADHGNDPTFRGTDHTREEVPLFVLYREQSRDLSMRQTFADAAATLAEFFQLKRWHVGSSFLNQGS